jgi:hypothetical protein
MEKVNSIDDGYRPHGRAPFRSKSRTEPSGAIRGDRLTN